VHPKFRPTPIDRTFRHRPGGRTQTGVILERISVSLPHPLHLLYRYGYNYGLISLGGGARCGDGTEYCFVMIDDADLSGRLLFFLYYLQLFQVP
jgi:hypothetical protein